DILVTMSQKEVRQLRKLLRSPFFVLREDVKRLFNCIADRHLKGRPIPSQELVFQKTFPDASPYEPLRLRGTMSDLLALIEEFLVITHRRDDKLTTRLLLTEIYRRRKLNKCYQSSVKKTARLLEEQPKRNADYYENMLGLQMEKMEYASSTKRTEHLYLQEISDTNDVLYLIKKLQNACAQLSHQSVYKTHYDYGLLNHLLEVIEQERYMRIPAIAIYYYCFRFLTEEDKLEYFHQFKAQLNAHKHQFTKEDLEAPYRLALNFCIRKMNKGDGYFTREAWELYKEGLEEEILLENNYIPRFTFNNMIALALLLQEFEWIDGFIQNSTEKLEQELRDQTISFNLARLAYARRQYGEALLHLQSSEYKDLVNSLIAKMLLVKIYAELKEFESLVSHLDSFHQFIRRREVSDYHRRNYLNIIRFVRKITMMGDYEKDKRANLRQEIRNEPVLSERLWLLEQL
ncbi:MAG: hypothetical protein AAGG75_27300, partial [Bacteroidota bacterium]